MTFSFTFITHVQLWLMFTILLLFIITLTICFGLPGHPQLLEEQNFPEAHNLYLCAWPVRQKHVVSYNEENMVNINQNGKHIAKVKQKVRSWLLAHEKLLHNTAEISEPAP
jgi:hypothetical protein